MTLAPPAKYLRLLNMHLLLGLFGIPFSLSGRILECAKMCAYAFTVRISFRIADSRRPGSRCSRLNRLSRNSTSKKLINSTDSPKIYRLLTSLSSLHASYTRVFHLKNCFIAKRQKSGPSTHTRVVFNAKKSYFIRRKKMREERRKLRIGP